MRGGATFTGAWLILAHFFVSAHLGASSSSFLGSFSACFEPLRLHVSGFWRAHFAHISGPFCTHSRLILEPIPGSSGAHTGLNTYGSAGAAIFKVDVREFFGYLLACWQFVPLEPLLPLRTTFTP